MQMTTGEEAQMKAQKQDLKKAQKKAQKKAGKKAGKKADKKVGKKAGKKAKSPAAKTPLIIWSADPNASAALAQALGQDLLDTLPDPETIEAGAQAPEMLLLCLLPVRFLCREMAQTEAQTEGQTEGQGGQGTAPGVALERWMDFARAVLAVNRRNRRRVHVLDITRTLGDPASLLARFGVKAPKLEPEIDTPLDPVLALLAQRCLDGNAAARALAGELEAVMADSGAASGADGGADGGQMPGDDPDAAYQAWRDAGRARQEASQVAGLLRTQMSLMQEESDLVQAQGHAAEAELQGLSENALLLEQRLAQMSEGMASYQAQLDQQQAEKAHMAGKLGEKEAALTAAGELMRGLEAQATELNAALSQSNAALSQSNAALSQSNTALSQSTTALARTESELNQTRTTLGAVEADRAGVLHHRDALQARIQKLETSHSYRVTAPLRALRALFANKG